MDRRAEASRQAGERHGVSTENSRRKVFLFFVFFKKAKLRIFGHVVVTFFFLVSYQCQPGYWSYFEDCDACSKLEPRLQHKRRTPKGGEAAFGV